MSMFDNIKDKVQGLVDEHGDKAGVGLDKAGDFVDEKTGGKYASTIHGGVGKAKGLLGHGERQAADRQDRPAQPPNASEDPGRNDSGPPSG